jgi:hypothetical protein
MSSTYAAWFWDPKNTAREVRLLKAKIYLGDSWQGHPGYNPAHHPWHPRIGAKIGRVPKGQFPAVYGDIAVKGPYTRTYNPPCWAALVVIAAALSLIACAYVNAFIR